MTTTEHVIDPVCAMLIDPTGAAGSRVHGERTYYLCSLRCIEKFDHDAEAYIAATRADGYRTWRAQVLTDVNSPPPA